MFPLELSGMLLDECIASVPHPRDRDWDRGNAGLPLLERWCQGSKYRKNDSQDETVQVDRGIALMDGGDGCFGLATA